jgi:tetratricopeptide (TPR) repeat protein
MARSTVSRLTGRRQPRVWAMVSAFAISLSAICYPPFPLKAQPAEEQLTPEAHLARNQGLIADAERLKLTPAQVGGLLSQMGSDYEDLGDFQKAEGAYTRALHLLEPVESARVSYEVTLSNLGSLYVMTKNFDAAENCQKRSLAIVLAMGDPLLIARAQAHLADTYLAMGKNKDAARYSSLAVAALPTLPKATAADKGSALLTYSYASCLTSHCDRGLEAAREVMRIVSASFAAESFPAGQAHVALGFVEGRMGMKDAADGDLREGVRILRMTLPASHPLMIHALDLYREYLAANHRNEEANKIADEQKSLTRNCKRCTVSVYGLRSQ